MGLNLTACLHEGPVMRKTVFILSTCVRMTHTQVFSEHVYTVVVLIAANTSNNIEPFIRAIYLSSVEVRIGRFISISAIGDGLCDKHS